MPNLLPFTLIFIIWTGAAFIAAIPFVLFNQHSATAQLLTIALVPALFVPSFPILAGLLSKFGQKGIVRGKFPRKPFHQVYFLRRIFGTCWTQVYYFKPLYAVILSIPFFKKMVFRLFGYKGSCDFTVYPDTWIRDLPILDVGSGAYLSNRATIGTNICLPNGLIMVDSVRVEENGLVGHLAVLAPGDEIGAKTEIGIGCAVGIRVKIKDSARIKPFAGINHGAIIGSNVDVGAASYIGMLSEIADGIKLPPGSIIPNGAIVRTQEDVENYYSSETEKLVLHKEELSSLIMKYVSNAP